MSYTTRTHAIDLRKLGARVMTTLTAMALVLMLGIPAALADDSRPVTDNQAAFHDPHSVYKETPTGPRSVPADSSRLGPHHLRQMSRTERLPAPIQVEKVIPQSQLPGNMR